MKTTITLEFTSKQQHDAFMTAFLSLLLTQQYTPGLKINTKREYQLDPELAGAPPRRIGDQLRELLARLGVDDAAGAERVTLDDTPLEAYINSLDRAGSHRAGDQTDGDTDPDAGAPGS